MNCPKCKKNKMSKCRCTVADGEWVHIPLMMKDGAPPPLQRAAVNLSPADRRAFIAGKPLHIAAASPLYDSVRGLVASGMHAPEYFALLDGAVPAAHLGGRAPTTQNIDDAANRIVAQTAYEDRISNAWKAA